MKHHSTKALKSCVEAHEYDYQRVKDDADRATRRLAEEDGLNDAARRRLQGYINRFEKLQRELDEARAELAARGEAA
jgi:hypothetical protein